MEPTDMGWMEDVYEACLSAIGRQCVTEMTLSATRNRFDTEKHEWCTTSVLVRFTRGKDQSDPRYGKPSVYIDDQLATVEDLEFLRGMLREAVRQAKQEYEASTAGFVAWANSL